MKRLALVFLILLPLSAPARVFSYKDSSLGAFIRGSGGLAPVNQDAFANSSGTSTVMTGESTYGYGGEFGFVFGLGSAVHLRLGAEIFQPNSVRSEGSSAVGAQWFTLNSTIFVFNPNVAIETVYSTSGNMRFFFSVGVGYATINVSNDYDMTAAGQAALGVPDFRETLDATAISGSLGLGMETLFTDNVTVMLDVGYRYLPVEKLTYGSDVNNIVKPTGAAKGDTVLNHDGENRKLNMSGVYGGLGFRFYLNFL